MRTNVYTMDGHLEGWFDRDKATEYEEAAEWNGRNHISLATGSQREHEDLYRTAAGRWVLHHWSQWQGSRDWYEFISKAHARSWLLANNHDAAVEKHFGKIEEECVL